MKKYSIRNSLGCEVGQVETSLGKDFAIALYASKCDVPLKKLMRINFTAKLICILL